jgi:hypothetical protein
MELDPFQKPGPEVLEFEKNAIKWNRKGSNFGRDQLKWNPNRRTYKQIFRVSKPNWRFSLQKGGTAQHSYLAFHNDLVKF